MKSSENLHEVHLGTQQDVINGGWVDYRTVIGCFPMGVNWLSSSYSRDKSAAHLGLAFEGRCSTHVSRVTGPEVERRTWVAARPKVNHKADRDCAAEPRALGGLCTSPLATDQDSADNSASGPAGIHELG